jgi:SAM-dependent methyltransferase
MSDLPLVWHYGLMAEYWAKCKTDAPEVPHLLQLIGQFGQPVLDLACGSGRILTKLLIAGTDADGVDISSDMIHGARKAASAHGFFPRLLAQPMHDLDLPRIYGTILICDSFGLGGSRQNDLSMFRHCREHLNPGGALIFNLQMEYTSRKGWDLWTNEARERLPADWPEVPIIRVSADGSEFRIRIRMVDVNPLDQLYVREMTIEKWQNGRRIATESSLLRGSLYLVQELLLMLKSVGFETVRIFGGYTENRATSKDAELVFVAINGANLEKASVDA